ncbi:MAG: 3-phosphoshikimate 1-carboxyvinyltransferase [Salinisphaeraceae bacterium]
MSRVDWDVRGVASPAGVVRVPGDKSISHRAVMLAAIAEGRSDISGFLEGEDCLATMRAFQAMGVSIARRGDQLVVDGVGRDGLQPPAEPLDLGNSGTSMRLLAGLLAGQAFDVTLTGDDSLRRRPMKRVIDPLRLMGAAIAGDDQGRAPLRIGGGARLAGIHYDMPVASAQVASCLLLAGLYASGETAVTEPGVCRDHTERMLRALGAAVTRTSNVVRLCGGQSLQGGVIEVPADISSAAFALVAGAINPDADLVIEAVGINPTRTGVLQILRSMGATIECRNERMCGGEPVADLHVRGGPLTGIDIDPALVPLAIDEFPVLFVAAACAAGTTRLRGAAELRVKESDRLAVMATGLRAMGLAVAEYEDGIDITGGPLAGARVDSHGDHRVAMAFAIAGLRAEGVVRIDDCANVATSFPGFEAVAGQLGLDVTVRTGDSV